MPWTKHASPWELRLKTLDLVCAGRTVARLARELEPTENATRNWIAQADRDAGLHSDGLTADERKELDQLRRENHTLREERDTWKRASAWFAQKTGATPPRAGSKVIVRVWLDCSLHFLHRGSRSSYKEFDRQLKGAGKRSEKGDISTLR